MSEDARKVCRTQGKYSERNSFEDKKYQKKPDRRVRESPTVTEHQEVGKYSEQDTLEDRGHQKKQDRRVRENPTVNEPRESRKYSEQDTYEDRRYQKRQDRRVREGPIVNEPQESRKNSEQDTYEDRRYQKRQDRRVREGPTVNEPQESRKYNEQDTYEDKRYQKRQDKRLREGPTVNEPRESRNFSEQDTYEDKRYQKRRDKRVRENPTVNEPQEKKNYKRRSADGRTSNTSLTSESEHVVRYEENSGHSFPQLEEVKKPVAIRDVGKQVLSSTENGDSVIHYYPHFFEKDESKEFMERLLNTTNWNEKNIVIHGKEFPQPRLVAWYGPFPYTYSGATLEPAEMPDIVLEIKNRVEDFLVEKGINVELNSVLLNLYRDNKDSVAWHSDDELTMGVCPTIASVSFGETRKFEMRRKLKQIADENSPVGNADHFIYLTNGSLLIMDGCMQEDWQHRVPKDYHDRDVRINLTFRTVYCLEDLPPSHGAYPKNKVCNSDLKSYTIKTDNGVIYDEENFPPLNSDIRSRSYSNKTGNGVSYDEENFPPLNSDVRSYPNKTDNGVSEDFQSFNGDASSPYSNVKAPLESDDDVEERTEYPKNKSSNRRSSEGLSYYKTPLKNSELSESQDAEHYVNYEDENSLPLSSNSSSAWSTIVIASPESNDPSYDFNRPYKRRNSDDLSYSKTSLRNSSAISESCGDMQSLTNQFVNCTIFPESENNHTTQVFHDKVPVKMHDKIIESESLWGYESSYSNDTVLKDNDALANRFHQQTAESYCIGKSAILNNLNDDKSNVKIDMQNKNLYDYNSDFSTNNVASSTQNENEDQNFHTKGIYHANSVNNIQKNAHLLSSETACDKNTISTLNATAREFVPQSLTAITSETKYDLFELENLVNYNADLMDGVSLKSYAFSLKAKVLEKLSEFPFPFWEELEFLCKITDGDQTEKNQKLISVRMCLVAKKALDRMRLQSPVYRKPYGMYPRKFNHANQNHSASRYHQYNNREGPFRH